jgi:hypothetical protein
MNAAQVSGAIIEQCNHEDNLKGNRAGRNLIFPKFRVIQCWRDWIKTLNERPRCSGWVSV